MPKIKEISWQENQDAKHWVNLISYNQKIFIGITSFQQIMVSDTFKMWLFLFLLMAHQFQKFENVIVKNALIKSSSFCGKISLLSSWICDKKT